MLGTRQETGGVYVELHGCSLHLQQCLLLSLPLLLFRPLLVYDFTQTLHNQKWPLVEKTFLLGTLCVCYGDKLLNNVEQNFVEFPVLVLCVLVENFGENLVSLA